MVGLVNTFEVMKNEDQKYTVDVALWRTTMLILFKRTRGTEWNQRHSQTETLGFDKLNSQISNHVGASPFARSIVYDCLGTIVLPSSCGILKLDWWTYCDLDFSQDIFTYICTKLTIIFNSVVISDLLNIWLSSHLQEINLKLNSLCYLKRNACILFCLYKKTFCENLPGV